MSNYILIDFIIQFIKSNFKVKCIKMISEKYERNMIYLVLF